jgi:hypothetical protein
MTTEQPKDVEYKLEDIKKGMEISSSNLRDIIYRSIDKRTTSKDLEQLFKKIKANTQYIAEKENRKEEWIDVTKELGSAIDAKIKKVTKPDLTGIVHIIIRLALIRATKGGNSQKDIDEILNCIETLTEKMDKVESLPDAPVEQPSVTVSEKTTSTSGLFSAVCGKKGGGSRKTLKKR